ncbi:MAG: SUMF1/EgtB/PvdO family nonheme iron enzyme [Gammaproteobacteria bacterium]|nr:SUMF1/EgtB/PvdO family nonheme iron enzyme [Gammaproteobacteria bacterium]MCP5424613.1 SUMF1/EgtB/PvdO family nonheme iron enzyme [Gammaproteobacteria bacterium]
MTKETNTLPKSYELEEYRVESVLGTGGFGITYKAQDTLLETWVAIKEYFPVEWAYRGNDGVGVHSNAQGNAPIAEVKTSGYEWGLDRFLEEARVLARVQHPYVVRVRRYFRSNGTAYIVMDFEEGEPLSALLRREETLSENDLRGMLDEVLPALEAVHREGYLHRDIKPSNLYVRARDGCVMLIDFGAARQSLLQTSKSVTGLVTPGYSPPEQYITRNDRYGPWTDLYALGAVLYRCVTSRAPTEAPDRQMWDSMPPAAEAGMGRYSRSFLAIVDKALAMRPEDRFPSVADMQAALKASAREALGGGRRSRFAPNAGRSGAFAKPAREPKSKPPAPPDVQLKPDALPESRDDLFTESDLESLLSSLHPRSRLPGKGSTDVEPLSDSLLPVAGKARLPGAGSAGQPGLVPIDPATETHVGQVGAALPDSDSPSRLLDLSSTPIPLQKAPAESLIPTHLLTPSEGGMGSSVAASPSQAKPGRWGELEPMSRLPHVEAEAPASRTLTSVQEPALVSPGSAVVPGEADAEFPADAQPEDIEEDVQPVRKIRRKQGMRLWALFTVLMAALAWAGYSVYLDYQEKQLAAEQQRLRAEQDNARRLAAQRAESEKKEALRAQAREQIEQARVAMDRGDLAAAHKLLNQAEAIAPDSPGLTTARSELIEAESKIVKVTIEVEPRIDMPMVLLEGTCFQMGSPPGAAESYINESQHQVCLQNFWLSQHEVTNQQYRLFQPDHGSGAYKGVSLNEDRQPVVDVSWQDAMAYAEWLSRQTGRRYRLPTEAEWEFAERAGTGTTRFWGDDPNQACSYANVADRAAQRAWGATAIHDCDDGQAVAAPVATYRPNPFRLQDMLGNVSEWTCSEYNSEYGGSEKRCSTRAPNEGSRVVRGGSWDDEPRLVRSADRNGRSPDSRDYGLGFRLVREP